MMPQGTRSRLRGAAGEGEMATTCAGCLCCLSSLFIIPYFFLMASIPPNQYGIQKNSFTGVVDETHVYRGGRQWCAPWKSFVLWPATQVTVEFSNEFGANEGPVRVKCGSGKSVAGVKGGGGQDMWISLAFQFTIPESYLVQYYLNFTTMTSSLSTIMRLAKGGVQFAATEFAAPDYWQHRYRVSEAMRASVKAALDSYVHVERFEIMDIKFAQKFEDIITEVQVSVSKKVINEYKQKVKEIEQQIAILQSNNDAHIKLVSSRGQAKAREIIADANREAFNMKQERKALMYKELKKTLGLSSTQMTEYFKIKAMQSGPSAISVGIDALDIEGLEGDAHNGDL